MKRIGHIYPDVCSADNLYNAYRLARKGKGDRKEVARFDLHLEIELRQLREELMTKTYQPGAYRYRTIYERKPRTISIAPFRDRVVHHALMLVVEPRVDPQFIFDSYACRKNKGVHCAVERYQRWVAHYPYVLHLDIAGYFASVDQAKLKLQLRRKIKDPAVLFLFDQIIESYSIGKGKGLPIGNLTSQFLANLYLNDFDHWLKHEKKQHAYLRYVDDFFILGRDKRDLWSLVADIKTELAGLALQLHPNKIHLRRTSERVDVLGYIVTERRRWLRNTNGYRFRRRFKKMAVKYKEGEMRLRDVQARVRSWIGHALHAETRGLRKTIFNQVTF